MSTWYKWKSLPTRKNQNRSPTQRDQHQKPIPEPNRQMSLQNPNQDKYRHFFSQRQFGWDPPLIGTPHSTNQAPPHCRAIRPGMPIQIPPVKIEPSPCMREPKHSGNTSSSVRVVQKQDPLPEPDGNSRARFDQSKMRYQKQMFNTVEKVQYSRNTDQ